MIPSRQLFALALAALLPTLGGCRLNVTPGTGVAGPASPVATAVGPQAPGSTSAIATPVPGAQTGAGSAFTPGKADTSVGLAGTSGAQAVMLTATWCTYCDKAKRPDGIWTLGQKDNPDVKFVPPIDVDQRKAEADRIGWTALPTFVFYLNGKEISRSQGADKASFSEALQKLKAANRGV